MIVVGVLAIVYVLRDSPRGLRTFAYVLLAMTAWSLLASGEFAISWIAMALTILWFAARHPALNRQDR